VAGTRHAMKLHAGMFLAALASACSKSQPASVLLVTLDTTRADALGCYGASPSVTPHLDALAAEGITFEWARTVTPTTLPAHTSMLTGLYPNRHTVRDNSLSAVPASATTVAELAQAAGVACGAFVSAKVLDRAFGLDQGFAMYTQPARENDIISSTGFAARGAEETALDATRWLASLEPEQPFLAWVHFFDPHRPWTASPQWLERASGNPYLAEVAATDAAVGSLIDELRRLGRLDHTTIVVVGDHGEGLGEHGEDSHAYFVYDSTLRVPLLVRRRDGARAGERVSAMASVVDVGPTICEALGIRTLPDVDGQSLYACAPDAARGVYFESFYGLLHYGMAPLVGWVDARGKYIHSSTQEFYEPVRAPREPRNLVEERSDIAAAHREQIARTLARATLEQGTSVQADAALLRNIESLGYASAPSFSGPLPDPLASSARPSPHHRADELRACDQGQRLFERGRFAEAEKLLGRVAQENPDNTFALEFLAHAQLRLGKFAQARASFERALERGPERAASLRGLGFALHQLREADQARARLTRAAELDPSDLEALRMLLHLAQEAGDSAAEERWRAALKSAAEL